MKRSIGSVAIALAAFGVVLPPVADAQERSSQRSSANLTARAALNRTLPAIDFTGVTLKDAIDFLRDISQANLHVNWRAVELAGITPDTPINMKLRSVNLRKVLNLLLSEAAGGTETLAWYLDDGVIEVTTKVISDGSMYTKVYDVADLLVEPPDVPINPDFQLPSSMESGGSGGGRGGGGGGRGGGGGGRSGGGGGSGGGSSLFFQPSNQNQQERRDKDAMAQELMELIRSVVQPDVWVEAGGKASMRFFNGNLIITAPRSVHEAIGGAGSVD